MNGEIFLSISRRFFRRKQNHAAIMSLACSEYSSDALPHALNVRTARTPQLFFGSVDIRSALTVLSGIMMTAGHFVAYEWMSGFHGRSFQKRRLVRIGLKLG